MQFFLKNNNNTSNSEKTKRFKFYQTLKVFIKISSENNTIEYLLTISFENFAMENWSMKYFHNFKHFRHSSKSFMLIMSHAHNIKCRRYLFTDTWRWLTASKLIYELPSDSPHNNPKITFYLLLDITGRDVILSINSIHLGQIIKRW